MIVFLALRSLISIILVILHRDLRWLNYILSLFFFYFYVKVSVFFSHVERFYYQWGLMFWNWFCPSLIQTITFDDGKIIGSFSRSFLYAISFQKSDSCKNSILLPYQAEAARYLLPSWVSSKPLREKFPFHFHKHNM